MNVVFNVGRVSFKIGADGDDVKVTAKKLLMRGARAFQSAALE